MASAGHLHGLIMLRKILFILYLCGMCLLAWTSTRAQTQVDIRPLVRAAGTLTLGTESNIGYLHRASGDSTEEDTANPFWDGTDDSIITTLGQAFYVGNTLNMTGKLNISVRTLSVGTEGGGTTSDCLIVRGKVQYGVAGGEVVQWFDSAGVVTLFGFDDTLATYPTTEIDSVWRTYSVAPTLKKTTNTAQPVLANVVRFIAEYPDDNYCQTYIDYAASSYFQSQPSNVVIEIIWCRQDSLR